LAQDTATTADDVVIPFTINITDQIDLISQTLTQKPKVSFSRLLTQAYTRQEVAVTFLAVLELIKQHRVQALQEQMFGEIVILPLPPLQH